MRTAILCCILLSAVGCGSTSKWSTTDKTLMTTYSVLNAVDILQTRYAFDSDDHHEANPILAPLGKDGATAVMVASNIGLYYLLDYHPQNRTEVLGILNFLKVAVVGRNASIGVGFAW